MGIPLTGIEVVNNITSPLYEEFCQKLYQRRARKGWSMEGNPPPASAPLRVRGYDGPRGNHGRPGATASPIPIPTPSARYYGSSPGARGIAKVAGIYMMIFRQRTLLFADATMNIHPDSEELAEIAVLAAEQAEFLGLDPKVAMISFSNFGSTRHPDSAKMVRAVELVRQRRPELAIDGEMQADTAVDEVLLNSRFPFNRLGKAANVMVFPDLSAANVAYKLLQTLGGAKAVGPLLMGLTRPFNVLPRGTDMENVVNVIALTVAQAQGAHLASGSALG